MPCKGTTGGSTCISTWTILWSILKFKFSYLIVYLTRKFTKNIEIFLQLVHDYDWSVNLPSGSRPFYLKLHCNMKVIPQYHVIGPYNYDRIIHNIEKNYAKSQDLGQKI